VAITPHGTNLPMGLILAAAGKSIAQNAGLAGGYPGNTGLDVVARQGGLAEMLGAGRMPEALTEISDTIEIGQCYAQSYLAPGDVFSMHWQGGGGYGDPLRRDPEAVARDVGEGKVSRPGAAAMYGVELDEHGRVDGAGTERTRARIRDERRERSTMDGDFTPSAERVEVAAGRRLDDNLAEVGLDGSAVVACRHCGQVLADAAGGAARLARYEGRPADGGPQIITDPADYVDAPIVFRQFCCPGCWTALYSAVVPADHPEGLTALGSRAAAGAS
jgi:N-methylhydantoinase B